MPRRRKKNPLLGRIVAVTLAVHAVVLPIAAHFGAFEKLKQHFQPVTVMLVPLPKQEKERPQVHEHKSKDKTAKHESKASVKRSGPARANPNRQKVVVSTNANDAGTDEGPSIEQGTQTHAGEVPLPPGGSQPSKVASAPGSSAATVVEKTSTPATTVTPIPKPKPVETPAPKHIPLFVEAEQDYAPQPVIPDDLRTESLDKNFVAMLTVGPDGVPTAIKVAQSTGYPELDEAAVATAKKWRFKPATLDGAPTESQVKLTIEFSVE